MPIYKVSYGLDLERVVEVEAENELIARELADVHIRYGKIEEWSPTQEPELKFIEEE